jgi:hypothetical protein
MPRPNAAHIRVHTLQPPASNRLAHRAGKAHPAVVEHDAIGRLENAEASPGGKGDFMKTLAVAVTALSTVLSLGNGAQAQEARKLFFEGDIVRHALENQVGPFCVLANQFKRKEAVAWRIRVLQPNGGIADDKVLKSVVVVLGNGQKLPGHYGGHGMPPTDHFWSLHWEIPADFPTGSLGYKVVATMMDDSTVTWEPFNRATTQLAVIAGEPAMKTAATPQ